MSLYNLHNSLSDTGIRLLNMQHLTHSRGNISNMNLARGRAMLYLPTIEQKWYMSIVGTPCAMGSTYGRRTSPETIKAWFQHKDDVARAIVVIAL